MEFTAIRKIYPVCFGVENATWEAAEKYLHTENCSKDVRNGEIIMPGGHLTVAQLTAMLNTIPMEITLLMRTISIAFSMKGQRISNVRAWAIDREVFSCHPPKWSSRCGTSSGNSGRGRSTSADLEWRKTEKPCWLPIWRCGMPQAHISDHRAGAGYGLCQRAFPFRRKSKRSSAARRYGRLTYFCFSI